MKSLVHQFYLFAEYCLPFIGSNRYALDWNQAISSMFIVDCSLFIMGINQSSKGRSRYKPQEMQKFQNAKIFIMWIAISFKPDCKYVHCPFQLCAEFENIKLFFSAE